MATPVVELDSTTSSSTMYNVVDTSVAGSSSDPQTSGSQAGSSGGKYSNGPHMRSRVTVVCAECKRLKLKCDRRTPCSSCLKRDTVQRCIYTQAAAEKIDIQSLHNRLLVVEGHLAQLTSGSPTTLASLPPFKTSYPLSTPPQPYTGASSQTGNPSSPQRPQIEPNSFYPTNDRALLITGNSGSSVLVSLDSTVNLWLNEIDTPSILDNSRPSVPPYSSSSRSGGNVVRVKLEPTPTTIPTTLGASSGSFMHSAGNISGFIPPIPHSIFIPVIDPRLSRGTSHSSPHSFDVPQVTPALLRFLPSTPSTRTRYMQSLTELMLMHPCFNIQHFEQRIDAMLSWGEANDTNTAKRDLARELFLGANSKKSEKEKHRGAPPPPSASPKPTLSFFAAACAAFALGALMTGDDGSDTSTSPSPSFSGSPSEEEIVRRSTNSTALFALSEQALSLFEKTSAYDLDSVVAMLLQVLYTLHDGQMRVAQTVFPLVGKAVNVARMMGLAMDPDEFAGTYSLFEAETRRRVWWDVCYYDWLVSDCMGQQPLVVENSFTTKIPADVDEERFSPSSTSIPTVNGGSGETAQTYLGLRCRLGQLIKGIRRQVTKDLAEDDASVEQAASGEQEINSWISELPESYRLNMEADVTHPLASSPSTSPFLMAQRCELVITANRAVLRLYIPFMTDPGASTTSKPSHQALMGTINAAHAVIYASRVLHTLWRDTRPAAFDFYDYGRSLFDAAVVCAYAAIQQPKNILAAEAVKGLCSALEVMRALDNGKSSSSSESNSSSSEAVRIVELMKEKAERARTPEVSTTTGLKRKRNESAPIRESTLIGGFQLPYVGPSVSSVKPEQSRAAPLSSKIAAVTGSRRDSSGNPHESKSLKTSSSSEKKDKEKSSKYPTIGIRVRTPQTSAAPPTTTSTTSTNHRQIAPINTSTQGPISPPDRSQQPSTLGSHSAVAYPYPQTQEPSSTGSMMHEFQMDFTSNPPSANEHYTRSYTTDSSPGSSTGYEHPPPPPSVTPFDNGPQPPHSFRTGPPPPPPPQDYYMSASPYTPNPPSYEQPPQNIGMSSTYGIPSSMDPAMSTGVPSIPSTPHDSYMMLPDKSGPAHFDAHLGKSELDRQMSADYQPTATSHSHGMPMTATSMTTPYVQQGWRPSNQWEYNKYYNHHA
ncbi:hypothetical protein BDY19DRAFT_950037 [Irpex rosettiformis]|uniref:Uncharacterized protein n=1 Tax=Irpex rosettiformis TaxID=378272 RepID=A0ACB8U1S6_9APHY|nr:hypothetical protein BDY19DRAFT_950037 [Irpex rosettiformis]